jgi:hypothetical protein
MTALARDCLRLHALMAVQERTTGTMREIWKAQESALRDKLREMAARKWPELNRVKGE